MFSALNLIWCFWPYIRTKTFFACLNYIQDHFSCIFIQIASSRYHVLYCRMSRMSTLKSVARFGGFNIGEYNIWNIEAIDKKSRSCGHQLCFQPLFEITAMVIHRSGRGWGFKPLFKTASMIVGGSGRG